MGPIVAARWRQVGIDVVGKGLRGIAAFRMTQKPRIRGVEHVRHGVRHEVVLRREVRVEAAVGESRTGHDFCHSDALDALAPDRRRSLGEDAGPSSLLVVLIVSHQVYVIGNTTNRQLGRCSVTKPWDSWEDLLALA